MRLSRRTFTGGAIAALAGCAGPRAPAPTPPPPRRVPEPAPSASTLPLFEAFPALASRIPRVALGTFPTPLERALDLGRAIGVGELWVKRDDVAGERYGGGKTRKLELLLAAACAAEARTVITFGAVGSNHAVATAIYARQLGLGAILMLLPGPADPRVRRNLLADQRFGADVRLSPGAAGAEAAGRAIALRDHADANPYVIPTGGTSPLGNVAFVNAAFELAAQVRAGAMPRPDVVYVALGTMGCAAGLAVGLRAAGLETTELCAVRASNPGTSSEAAFGEAIAKTRAFLEAADPRFDGRPGHTRIDGRHLGRGYSLPTPGGLRAVELARAHAGLELEPVYTGKALAALIDDAPRLRGKVVLFWNTESSRPLDLEGADWRALPRELQAYFEGG